MIYDTMPAGPELDRLVAEKVMGWADNIRPGTGDCVWYLEPGPTCPHWGAWEPSTNIAHAWEVADVVMRSGSFLRITGSCGTARCDIDGVNGMGHATAVVMDTQKPYAQPELICLAICRAALKASLSTNHTGREG